MGCTYALGLIALVGGQVVDFIQSVRAAKLRELENNPNIKEYNQDKGRIIDGLNESPFTIFGVGLFARHSELAGATEVREYLTLQNQYAKRPKIGDIMLLAAAAIVLGCWLEAT